MNAAILTTRDAARALGVSQASLKRWCDQGLLLAVRTPGGHRRLPLNSVVQFVRERQFEMARPDLLGLPHPIKPTSGDLQAWRLTLQRAFEVGDEFAARQLVLGRYLAGASAERILDQVVAPAFTAIGEKWSHGALAIYEERRAVEMCTRLLHQLSMYLPTPSRDAPHAIGGTLADDPYSIATMMVELVLCEAGWRARSYGVGLPVDTLVRALRDVRPRLLWVSVNAIESEERFIEEYRRLYEASESLGIAVMLGGRALKGTVRARIPYSAYCDTLQHAAAFARAIFPGAARRGEEER